MPFPLAHPAATLPFRRWCPQYLNFSALVVGSLVPDLATSLSDSLEYFSHTILGSFIFCLPIGLLTFWIFRQVFTPVIATLPNPHRDVLRSICIVEPNSFIQIVVSLLIGIWLHIVWDSFTHDHSWLVRHSVLSSTMIAGLPLNRIVWLLSSIAGVAIPLLMYLSILRRRKGCTKSCSSQEWRAYAFWLGVLSLPLAGAIPLTLKDPGYSHRNLVSFLAMYYFSCFYLTVAGLGFFMKYKQKGRKFAPDSNEGDPNGNFS